MDLHYAYAGAYRKGERGHCVGATFGARNGYAAEYETGAYSLLMPGYNAHRQRVTMETLDDSGEVIAASTLPIEPKKGGVIWDRAAVRKAAGPVAKGKAARMPVIAATEVLEEQEALEPVQQAAEPIEALSAPPVEPASEPCSLPATDSIADILTRVADLEARVATLSEQSQVTPIGEARAKRTPAHERAIRRAWAERSARRALQTKRARAVVLAKRHWKMRLVARGQYQAAEAWGDRQREGRHTVIAIGRGLVLKTRAQRDAASQRAKIAEASVARMKRDMADASQPERASDLARLMRERDEARTANAALQARADRSEKAVTDLAERFEGMVSRVSRAEAALRIARAA
jgi:hypothetical protein